MARLRLEGNSAGAVRAIQDLNKAVSKTDKELEEATKAGSKLEKQAKRIAEQADPMRKYNRQIAEVAQHMKAGRLSIQEANRAAEMYGDRLERVGRRGKRSFGGIEASVKSMAGGIFTLTGAVGALVKGFTEAEQAAQAAADAAFASIGAQGELQQLGPEAAAEMSRVARNLIRRGIFAPEERGAAFQTAFNLESARIGAAGREALFQRAEDRFITPENIVGIGGSLAAIQESFGVGQTGNISDLLDKLVTAAQESQTNVAKFAGAFPRIAPGAAASGFQFNETAATLLALNQAIPDIGEATTALRGFFSQVERGQLGVGGDITDTLDAVQKRLEAGEQLIKIFPDLEGRAGARALLEARAAGGITAAERSIAGGIGAFARQRGRLAADDPIFGSGVQLAQSRGILAAAEEANAERENLFDAVRAEMTATRERRGTRVFPGFANFLIESAIDIAGAEESVFRQQLRRRQWGMETQLSPQLMERIENYMERTARSNEQMAASIEEMNGRQNGAAPAPMGVQE